MRSPDELTDLFRSRGLKATPQRQAIFRVLHRADSHPSAEAVHAEVSAQMPTVSLRTVYQTLNDLAAMGELQALELGTGAARFDPNLDRHHHLVCDSCGAVRDLHVDFGEVEVEADDRQGFEIETTEIVFRGRCAACAARSGTNLQPTPHPKESAPHA